MLSETSKRRLYAARLEYEGELRRLQYGISAARNNLEQMMEAAAEVRDKIKAISEDLDGWVPDDEKVRGSFTGCVIGMKSPS